MLIIEKYRLRNANCDIPVEKPTAPRITGGIAMSRQPTPPKMDRTWAPLGVLLANTL